MTTDVNANKKNILCVTLRIGTAASSFSNSHCLHTDYEYI